jgi:hypothetical protein
VNVDLSWSGGDLDGDSVTYDVYFEADDSTPDELASDDQATLAYDPGTLNANTQYYWRIVAQDEHGATTPGPVWTFTTDSNSADFELGGWVNDLDLPESERMHYAGMNWIKVLARYPDDVSTIIETAHAKDFKVQVTAVGSSEMVTQTNFEQDYANWVHDLTVAGTDAIEVWNEPNIPRDWPGGYISPDSYTDLLCAAYTAIKAVDADTLVISAAPAPTGYFGGCGSGGCDDLPWIEGIYAAGANSCMDYIGAHHASGATSPSVRSGHPADPDGSHHSWYFLWQTEEYYAAFDDQKQIFYTVLGYLTPEGFGWVPDAFSWAEDTTVAQQAQWLAEVAELSQQTGMVGHVMIWNVDFDCYGDCGGYEDPQAGYAIIRPDDSCPACDSLHAVVGSR